MSALGHKRTFAVQKHVRFTPKADMCDALAHVRFVPIADISFAATRLHRGSSISYFLKRLTTATATITATTTSAQISSFEIVSRPQPIICVSPFLLSVLGPLRICVIFTVHDPPYPWANTTIAQGRTRVLASAASRLSVPVRRRISFS